jgi:hypothetical protein
MGEMRSIYKILFVKAQSKRSLVDLIVDGKYIKCYLRTTECEGSVDCIQLTQIGPIAGFVITLMSLRVS